MGRSTSNPTIRVLMLGSPGVGKNCLESRFMTMTYPPPYGSAMTQNSRRFFTLTPRPSTPPASITRPEGTSPGMLFKNEGPFKESSLANDRPRTASSTYSNPPSEPRDLRDFPSALQPHSHSPRSVLPVTCVECFQATNSFMVEMINYPGLQFTKERALVIAKGEYDAVLLVYDVADRYSFHMATALHNEIALWQTKSPALITRRNSFMSGSSPANRDMNDARYKKGAKRETVVALVGNKSDFDAEYASVEFGLDSPLFDKEAEMQQAEIRERDMVHPLLRESKFYDDIPLSPRSLGVSRRDSACDVRRSVMSADMAYPRSSSVLARRRSVRSVKAGKEMVPRALPRRPSRTSVIEHWLETGSPTVETGSEPGREELAQAETLGSESTTASRRQISHLEGEVASQRLGLSIPFLETSAKTGENVEELFEAVVRQVLREMGREVGQETTKQCWRHAKPRKRELKRRVSVGSTQHPVIHEMTPANSGSEQINEDTAVEEEVPTANTRDRVAVEGDDTLLVRPIPTAQRPRRESVMRRVRSLFLRRPQPNFADVAA